MRFLSNTVRFVAASVATAALAVTLASMTHGTPKAAHTAAFQVASIKPMTMNPWH